MNQYKKKNNILLVSFNMYKGGSLTIYDNLKPLILKKKNLINITFGRKYKISKNKKIKLLYPIKYFNLFYRLFIEQVLVLIVAFIKRPQKVIMLGNFPCILFGGSQKIFFHNLLYLKSLKFPLKYGIKLTLESLFWKLSINLIKPDICVQTDYVKKSLENHFKEDLTIKTIGCPIKNKIRVSKKCEKIKDFSKTFSNIISDNENIHFIYPAAYYPHKNHKFLFESADLFKKEKIKIHLTFSQNHIQKNDFDSRCFVFYEHLNELEINYLYSKVDALIYTSLSESLGMPLLEITKHNKPVIAIDMNYVESAIKNFYLFKPSQKSLAKTIKSFKTDIFAKKLKIARSNINTNPSIFFEELLY